MDIPILVAAPQPELARLLPSTLRTAGAPNCAPSHGNATRSGSQLQLIVLDALSASPQRCGRLGRIHGIGPPNVVADRIHGTNLYFEP